MELLVLNVCDVRKGNGSRLDSNPGLEKHAICFVCCKSWVRHLDSWRLHLLAYWAHEYEIVIEQA